MTSVRTLTGEWDVSIDEFEATALTARVGGHLVFDLSDEGRVATLLLVESVEFRVLCPLNPLLKFCFFSFILSDQSRL
jgi:hypothetical protein